MILKKALFPILFLLILDIAQGQVNIYHPFPTSNAFWQYEHVNYITPPYYRDQTRYGISGDTTVKGKIYHKIYSLFDTTIATQGSNFHNTYTACIREEAKKIYSIASTDTLEHLLYDFNLLIGDTIHYTYYTNFSRIVTSIDSILLLDGKYRKRYSFNGIGGSNPDIVIEGIGSNVGTGLFEPFVSAECTCEDGYNFTCFKENDTAFYVKNPRCNRCFCEYTSSINEVKQQNIFNIYPNPFYSQTTLQVDGSLNDATLTVYNSLGQQVKQIKNITTQTTLQRDNLSSGLYFIFLLQNGRVIATDKLVIVDK